MRRESGINFRQAIIRNHYVGRTFIEPSQSIRSFGVRLKLNPIKDLINGRRIVLVDDSIVRGTTSKKIVQMVREAGAAEVHMRISCPPTTHSCYYGVDTPHRQDLIASRMSVEEIREYIGADSPRLSLARRNARGDRPRPRLRLCRLLDRQISDAHRQRRRGLAVAGCQWSADPKPQINNRFVPTCPRLVPGLGGTGNRLIRQRLPHFRES